MKTQKEIQTYIQSKDWYPKFEKYSKEASKANPAWKITYDRDLIGNAFQWETTMEGRYYWQAVNADYQQWYYGKLRTPDQVIEK